jgi:hypothetical protein
MSGVQREQARERARSRLRDARLRPRTPNANRFLVGGTHVAEIRVDLARKKRYAASGMPRSIRLAFSDQHSIRGFNGTIVSFGTPPKAL